MAELGTCEIINSYNIVLVVTANQHAYNNTALILLAVSTETIIN